MIFLRLTIQKNLILVFTPRCEVSQKKLISVCNIIEHQEVNSKNVGNFIVDNIKYRQYRYIPKAITFSGGMVDFSSANLIDRQDLLDKYSYLISLSDELINDIISKYCSYISRSGIEEINVEEVKNLFDK